MKLYSYFQCLGGYTGGWRVGIREVGAGIRGGGACVKGGGAGIRGGGQV